MGGMRKMKNHSVREKALKVLKELSLDEKINLLHGSFLTGGIPRLEIPQMLGADGPMGIRKSAETENLPCNEEVLDNPALNVDGTPTALPSTISLAATFNIGLARKYGEVLGREALFFDINVLFGPGINVMRDPRNGRNYEYLGEDPIQTALMGCAYIEGLQSYGVAACAKHYYANDEEPVRHFASSNLDDDVGMEIYLRPFLIACERAGLWTMMTGNHLVNGIHVSENPEALAIPRDEVNWDGIIMTDWRAAYEPEAAMKAGLDMTTGFCGYVYGDGRLKKLVESGKIPESYIDEKALRVLMLYVRIGLIEPYEKFKGEIATAKHLEISREIAAESMVLLKNDDAVLPLKPEKASKILVTGAGVEIALNGTGSSNVYNGHEAVWSITPLAGIKEAYPDAEVIYEPDIAKAESAVNEADAVIFCACTKIPGEGKDLGDIDLADSQEDDIIRLGKAAPNLIVVVQCGSAVGMGSWIGSARAVLVAWLGGQMLGPALGDILTGKTSPSGKLPCTFGKSIDDYPCEKLGLWPAKLILDEAPASTGTSAEDRFPTHAYDANYDEGFYIGYRWFDKHNIEPLYPFGFGLSYTTFELSSPKVEVSADTLMVKCQVVNTGDCSGGEVVQVYVASPMGDKRPEKELKGFAKIFLKPGDKGEVGIDIPLEDLRFYDSGRSCWFLPGGEYKIMIGTSSRKIDFTEKVSFGK